MPLADIRPALRSFLLADAAISTAIGGKRIHPSVLPQGEVRASLVYTLISDNTDHHTQGPSGLVMARMQIDAWAQLPNDADTLARAVKDRLDGYRGLMGSISVQACFSATARTDYASEPKLHRASRDFLIWYAER